MNTTDMEKDWLAGNAVVAFVGALLLGQSWRMPQGPAKLLFVFAIPDFTALLIIGLFVLSLAFALASLVAPLRRWALDAVPAFSPSPMDVDIGCIHPECVNCIHTDAL